MQLELVYRELIGAELLGEDVTSPLRLVGEIISELELALENGSHALTGYQAAAVHVGGSGRPRFNIPRNQLVCTLLEARFTVPQIAEIIGVSIRTARRRMTEYSLNVRSLYSDISNEQLDRVVGDVMSHFPMCGNRQMQGHLMARDTYIVVHATSPCKIAFNINMHNFTMQILFICLHIQLHHANHLYVQPIPLYIPLHHANRPNVFAHTS